MEVPIANPTGENGKRARNSMIPVILKFLMLKFLGIKFYEKYALPAAVGYIVGTGFGGFILLTIHALR